MRLGKCELAAVAAMVVCVVAPGRNAVAQSAASGVLAATAAQDGGKLPDANMKLPNGSSPLAIVPIESANRDQAKVSGALQVTNGTAFIVSNGTVTSGDSTTNVVLPRRGVLRVCASTTVSLSADSTVPASEGPGLMMAMDRGGIEASFAIGRNSDVLLTPDFRIVIGGPGSSEVKVRLGAHGDTCVDNPGANAPYVLVSSVFDGGAYRVLPGQRVMFQHGSLQEVVDQEKEPCGCPPPRKPNSNEFPMDESAGLTLKQPVVAPPPPVSTNEGKPQASLPLVFPAPAGSVDAEPNDAVGEMSADTKATATPAAAPKKPAAPVVQNTPPAPVPETSKAAPTPATVVAPVQAASPAPAPAPKKAGFFRRAGRFFRRLFGAD